MNQGEGSGRGVGRTSKKKTRRETYAMGISYVLGKRGGGVVREVEVSSRSGDCNPKVSER